MVPGGTNVENKNQFMHLRPNTAKSGIHLSTNRSMRLKVQNHYKLAMVNLEQLENEYSQKDAITSLKSILNVMKNTV